MIINSFMVQKQPMSSDISLLGNCIINEAIPMRATIVTNKKISQRDYICMR